MEEENFELKGRTIVKYSYRNVETPVSSWIDMFEHVVKYLHNEDKTILPSLTDSTTDLVNLSVYFSSDPQKLRIPLKIDEHLYVEKKYKYDTESFYFAPFIWIIPCRSY